MHINLWFGQKVRVKIDPRMMRAERGKKERCGWTKKRESEVVREGLLGSLFSDENWYSSSKDLVFHSSRVRLLPGLMGVSMGKHGATISFSSLCLPLCAFANLSLWWNRGAQASPQGHRGTKENSLQYITIICWRADCYHNWERSTLKPPSPEDVPENGGAYPAKISAEISS